MQQIELGDTRRLTTRLGFGCSSLMGAIGRRDSLRLLDAAFEAGIRHFDVAPMYGYGEAESCLGEFLQRHRGEVTIATKYGIAPAKRSRLRSFVRPLATGIVKALPRLKHRLAGAARAGIRTEVRPTFTSTNAKASLERSLAALRCDRIDLWLLHEVTADDLRDEGLLHLLETEAGKGTIGTFGIGSGAEKIRTLLARHPGYCRTLQYEWSVFDPVVPALAVDAFRIHHRSLNENFRRLSAIVQQRPQLLKSWSARTGTDLTDPDKLARLMLKAALVLNPASIILFSSRSLTHIQANAQLVFDTALEAPAIELYRLVQTDLVAPVQPS